VGYDGPKGEQQGQQLSRSTVWKWLTWLGGLKEALQRATRLVLETSSTANPARDVPPIAAKKFCLAARHDVLHFAARLLGAAETAGQLLGVPFKFTREETAPPRNAATFSWQMWFLFLNPYLRGE
jgi:hypothetical protein